MLARAILAFALAQPSLTLVHPPSRLSLRAAGHPIHWHVDKGIAQEIAHYNARRRKNLAGWGAIDSLAGEGYKVRRRPACVSIPPRRAPTELCAPTCGPLLCP